MVDAQLPPALADWLRSKGHEAWAVRDIGLRDAPDAQIWARARDLEAIIATKDEDFAQAASTGSPGPPVLWVRTGNLVNRLLLARFDAVWPQVEAHLDAGARVVELR